MKKLKTLWAWIAWADTIQTAGWYLNRAAMISLVSLLVATAAAFGLDLGLTADQQAEIGAGIAAILLMVANLAGWTVGRQKDAKRKADNEMEDFSRQAADADPPQTINETRDERRKELGVGKTRS